MDGRELFVCCVAVFLGVGLVGFSLKFLTYVNSPLAGAPWFSVTFPPLPNLFDVLFIFVAGAFLVILAAERFARAHGNF